VFQPVYSKTRNEVYNDFYKPCMENSIKYDRVTGYFGSSVFKVINPALKDFVLNDGKIRIICSPILTDEDFEAISNGYYEKVKGEIEIKLDEIIDELSSNNFI